MRQALLVLQELQVLRVSKVLLVPRDHKVRPVLQVCKALQDQQVLMDQQVLLAPLDLTALRVRQVFKGQQVFKALPELLVLPASGSLVLLASKDQQVPLVLQAPRAYKARQVQQVLLV